MVINYYLIAKQAEIQLCSTQVLAAVVPATIAAVVQATIAAAI